MCVAGGVASGGHCCVCEKEIASLTGSEGTAKREREISDYCQSGKPILHMRKDHNV